MKEISVKHLLNSDLAVTSNSGVVLFELLDKLINEKIPLIVDFEGITLTTSAFLNVVFGKLYFKYSSETIKNLITVKNMQKDDLHILKIVVDNARQKYQIIDSNKTDVNSDAIDSAEN